MAAIAIVATAADAQTRKAKRHYENTYNYGGNFNWQQPNRALGHAAVVRVIERLLGFYRGLGVGLGRLPDAGRAVDLGSLNLGRVT